MFIHSFRYELLQYLREKEALWWNLLFPLVLATLFHIAFSGLASDELFTAIPTAVVTENEGSTAFREVIDTLNEPGENRFLDVTYCTKEEALTLLEQKKVIGILYEGSPVTLAVSAEMNGVKLEQSILSCFVEQYNMQAHALEQIAATHPENLPAAIDALNVDTAYTTESSYSDGDMDPQTTYFFSLIAMSCLFASMGGSQVAIRNQANLSQMGARRCLSPVPKSIALAGALLATVLFQFLCVSVGVVYMREILNVNFGREFFNVLLTCFIGCFTGVSMGFCTGCISHMGEGVKSGLLMAVTMLLSFLSGLMMGNIRIYIENYIPWLNRINPAALISDSFYALSIYQSHSRYLTNLATLIVISVLFCATGFIMVRRDKYAAL